jgi:tellurite resistance protein TehA-like permease
MISKIKKSIQQDLATNKLSVFTALVINTLVLTSNTRDDTFNEIIFWICLILEALIIFSISAMVYYKVKND